MRLVGRLASLAAILAMSSCALLGAARSDRAALAPRGGPPIDGTLHDLSGTPQTISSLRGCVVLLDFFATWCEPCRRGLPHTDEIARSHSGSGFAAFAISIDDTLTPVAPFVDALKLALPVRWDESARVADSLGIEMLPAALLLDRRGAVRFRASADDPEFAAHLEKALDALLEESAHDQSP